MTTYSLASYAGMLSDRTRVPAYLEALSHTVRPGSTVLDLGAGFGYFALAACRLGAQRVYAIEPAESVSLVPELARLNGFGDRIVAIRDLSTRVSLPEKVDVIVADIRGALPMLSGSLRTMFDARDRFLAPGGTLIPWRDRLFAAPVDDRGTWAGDTMPWADMLNEAEATAGLDFGPVSAQLAHASRSAQFQASSLLHPGKVWGEIDYHNGTAIDVEGAVNFVAPRDGAVHSFAVWFEANLMPGIRYATGPGHRATVYGTLDLPLPRPLMVAQGDQIDLKLASNDVGGEYHLRWQTKHTRDGKILQSFDQGDFYAEAFDLERLKRRVPSHVPVLKEDAQVAAAILRGAQEGKNLGQIAAGLCEVFPQRFASASLALDHAAKTLDRING